MNNQHIVRQAAIKNVQCTMYNVKLKIKNCKHINILT